MSKNKNTTDSRISFFLDAGSWDCDGSGQAHTPFALVSGHDIVLASWLRHHPDEQSGKLIKDLSYLALGGGNAAFEPAPLVKQFLIHAASPDLRSKVLSPLYQPLAKTGSRGYVLKWCRIPTRLTPDNQLLVVVGDLHLQLFTGTPIDLFRYKLQSDMQVYSLDIELRMLLELAALLKQDSKGDVISVQVGDMYEIWESEIVLRHLYLFFLYLHRRYKLNIPPMPSRMEITSVDIPSKIVERVVDLGKVPSPPHFYDLLERDRAMKEGAVDPFPPDAGRIDRDGINFRSTDDICEAIRRQHPLLFTSENDNRLRTKIFDMEIRGNHDNFASNRFWVGIMKGWDQIEPQLKQYDSHGFFRMPTEKSSSKALFDANRGSIWIEHGHIYDWHNNNRDWWLREHGFEIVYLYLYNEILKKFHITKWHAKGAAFARRVANIIVDKSNYEMRLAQLERAIEFRNGLVKGIASDSIKLLIMGHTHEAYLASYDCLWAQKRGEYIDYLKGKYFLKNYTESEILKEYGPR